MLNRLADAERDAVHHGNSLTVSIRLAHRFAVVDSDAQRDAGATATRGGPADGATSARQSPSCATTGAMRVQLRAETDPDGIVTVYGVEIENDDLRLPPIRWPHGFTGTSGQPAQIISDSGEVVAQEGDIVVLEGWAMVENFIGLCLIDGVY